MKNQFGTDPAILPADVPILNNMIAEKEAEIARLEQDKVLCPFNANGIDRHIRRLKIVVASFARLAGTGVIELGGEMTDIH